MLRRPYLHLEVYEHLDYHVGSEEREGDKSDAGHDYGWSN